MNNPNFVQTAREKVDPVIATGLAVVALVAVGIGYNKAQEGGNDASATAGNTPGQIAPTGETGPVGNDNCEAPSWAHEADNNDNNRVDGNGQDTLGDADTTAEARAAANEWLADRKDGNPVVFAGMAKSMVHVNVNPDKYYDEEGCATDYAVMKVAEVQAEIDQLEVSTKDPSKNSRNTGVSNGQFVQASQPGISGDNSGITLKNKKTGEVIGLMDRCANPTLEGDIGIPEGPTDQPPKKNPPKITPKKDKNTTPGGVPGQNHGTPSDPEKSRPHPGSSPDNVRQPQKPKPAPIEQPVDTRPKDEPAEESPIPPVTQPPINDNGSADNDKTTDPGGF